MSIWTEAAQVVAAMWSGDPYEMQPAFRRDGVWLVFGALTLVGGFAVQALYRIVPWLDRNLERAIIVYTYLVIAGIIFAGVIQRFYLNGQPPWSTTIPPLLFMIMAWFGCSYNVRLRTHLSFSEFRVNLPRPAQLGCLILDAVLWLGFCIIVVVTTAKITVNSVANFQIVLGTDNLMQWWFLITVPLAFTLMAARVIENLSEDLARYRSGQDLIQATVIGEDTI